LKQKLEHFPPSINFNKLHEIIKGKGKGKTILLQAWTGPEISMRLKLPDFKTIDT